MRIGEEIKLRAIANEWFEYSSGYQVLPTSHPPSLKNPQKAKIPTATEGFEKGASKAQRQQALSDLVEIHKRMRRQTGKPEISHQALFPLHPNISQWT